VSSQGTSASTTIDPNIASTPKNFASMMPAVRKLDDHDPDIVGEGPQDRVEGQEVPFRHDMRRRHQRVGLDVVVGVAEIVRHEADDREEHHQDHRQREQVLDHEIGPERQGVALRLVFEPRRTSTPVGLLLPVVWNAQICTTTSARITKGSR
jgi:hypothetical protein